MGGVGWGFVCALVAVRLQEAGGCPWECAAVVLVMAVHCGGGLCSVGFNGARAGWFAHCIERGESAEQLACTYPQAAVVAVARASFLCR